MTIALLAGVAIGLLSGIKLIDHVLLLFFHRHFLLDDSYGILYDKLDHDSNFEMMKNQPNPPKSYADFLRLHEKHREHATKDFKFIVNDVVKYLSARYLLVFALSAVFLANWYWYLAGVLVAQLLHVVYGVLIREHGRGFYVTLMLLTILGKSPKK